MTAARNSAQLLITIIKNINFPFTEAHIEFVLNTNKN